MDDWSWVGPAIGAIAGYYNSQNNTPSQINSQTVPPQLQGLLAGVGQRGMELGNMPYNPYPYNRVADFNPYQLGAFDQISGAAQNSGALTGANSFLGGLFNPGTNPQADATMKYYGDQAAGAGNAAAFNSGSFGNAGVAQAQAQGVANAQNQVRMQALGQVPSIASAQYLPGQQLSAIGGQMQQQGQNILDANYNQWQQAQQWPFQTYNAMLGAFGHNTGGTTSVTQPQNPIAGALGGAMFGNYMQGQWSGGGNGYNGNQFQATTGMGAPNTGPQQGYPWGG